MKKKNPKIEKDKNPGAPPPPSPEKPKPVNDEKVSFNYNSLVFEDFYIVGTRRFVKFFVDAEPAYFVNFGYGEFIEMQLAIWEAKNTLLQNSKEGEEICICDKVEPLYDRLDEDIEVPVVMINPENNEVKEVIERLPNYVCYNLVDNITVGNLCNSKKKK